MHATADTTPDLTLYSLVHRAMRGDARRLALAVDGFDRGDRRRAAAASRWFAGYLLELHEHHMIEDDIMFPALLERVPVFLDQVRRVDADHLRLDELLSGTEAALRMLADPSSDWAQAQAQAARVTSDLADLLDEHLAFEDDDILPLITRHITAAEYDELEDKARKQGSLSMLLFTIPWVVDWATDEEHAKIDAEAPFVFRLLWHARKRSYARLAQTVFADIAKVDVARVVA